MRIAARRLGFPGRGLRSRRRAARLRAGARGGADPRAGKGFIATPGLHRRGGPRAPRPVRGPARRRRDGRHGRDGPAERRAHGPGGAAALEGHAGLLAPFRRDRGHRALRPTQRPAAGKRPVEEYDKWSGDWYNTLSPEPFQDLVRPGTALVIDDAERADVGSIGSNNIMAWKLRGAVGVVTDATARDTDEIVTEKMPLYFRRPGRGIRPGRNEIESVNRPIVCGGVLVIPGDVIVADGDGVLVVPARGGGRRGPLREAHPRGRQGRPAQALREARPAEGQVGRVGRGQV